MSLSPKIIKHINNNFKSDYVLIIAINAFNDAKNNIGENNDIDTLAIETIRLLTINKCQYIFKPKQSAFLTNNNYLLKCKNKICCLLRPILYYLKKIFLFTLLNLFIFYNITYKYYDDTYSIALIILLYTSILSSITLYYISLLFVTSFIYYIDYDIGIDLHLSFFMMFYIYPLCLHFYTKILKYLVL
jgi:hypothetical protein